MVQKAYTVYGWIPHAIIREQAVNFVSEGKSQNITG